MSLFEKIIPPVITILIFFLILFVYTKLAGPISFSVNSVSTQKTDSFNVTGEGKVTATPDLGVVNLGVHADGTTVQDSQNQLNSSINRVTEAVKKLGIDQKDIKTQNYNINPKTDFTQNQKITGYSADTNLQIKVRQVDKANSVIDAATQAGANQVGGVDFQVEDRTKFEDQARTLAVEDAKKKAQAASKIAGFSLGKIINYQEGFNGSILPRPIYGTTANVSSDKVATQVEPGTNEIVMDVTLSYEVR